MVSIVRWTVIPYKKLFLAYRLRRNLRRNLFKQLGVRRFMDNQPTGHHNHAGFLSPLKNLYERHYAALLFITIMMTVLAFAQIGYQYYTTGDFIHRGVSLKGGVIITVPDAVVDQDALESDLRVAFHNSDLQVRTIQATKGVSIEAADVSADELVAKVSSRLGGLEKDQYSVEVIGSSLGKSFFKELFFSIGLAYVLMGIVVLLFYRTIVPSAAVITCAFCDMICTVAVYNLTGRTMSSAGIAALLMLIGYSVDTDMLLTSRVLRRKEGTVMDRVYSAFSTGTTQTMAAIAAVTVALFVTHSDVIREVMTVLLIGLFIDFPMTWIQNAAMIRKYMEGRTHEHKN